MFSATKPRSVQMRPAAALAQTTPKSRYRVREFPHSGDHFGDRKSRTRLVGATYMLQS